MFLKAVPSVEWTDGAALPSVTTSALRTHSLVQLSVTLGQSIVYKLRVCLKERTDRGQMMFSLLTIISDKPGTTCGNASLL